MNLIKKLMSVAFVLQFIASVAIAATISDKDGNKYKTIKIGKQHWMAEDYRFEHYNSQCAIRGDNPDDCIRAYAIYMMSDKAVRELCPTGWRLPTKDDFIELKNFLTPNNLSDMSEKQKRHAKAKMSSQLRSTVWENGEDSYGFNAIPQREWGGNAAYYGGVAGFYDGFGGSQASMLFFGITPSEIKVEETNKSVLLRVRCVEGSFNLSVPQKKKDDCAGRLFCDYNIKHLR